jgi:formamidopyrimidine-DNA glycosylase
MPEGIEIEYYRRGAELVVGRTVASVDAPDSWYLKGDTSADALRAALVARRFVRARRRGKLLMLDTDDGTVVGMRFGMTGRLIVDERPVIDRLEYSSDRDDPAWDRFGVTFVGGTTLRMRDPRRLGGVELEPDEAALGVDLVSVRLADLARILGASRRPLKARLLDQSQVAGLGNLLVDEILWRAGLDPARPADSLDADERRRLAHHLRRTVRQLEARGGSHTGDLHLHRVPGGRCPLDGALLKRHTIGGRTTYACPQHQAGKDTTQR